MMALMQRLAHQHQKTVVSSTHDLDLALQTADQVWLLSQGDEQRSGVVVGGTPEEVVLSGAFAAAFESENVQYEVASARFRLREHGVWEAVLTCDPHLTATAEFEWTRRLLERLGLRTCANAEQPLASVHLSQHDDGLSWQVRHLLVEQTFRTFSDCSGFITRARRDGEGNRQP